ncbi:MAG: hypothetical protein ACEQSA_02155 [Weeksellaceae bacterium]
MKNAIKLYLSSSVFALVIFLFLAVPSILAQVIPTFPTCLNPQGALKVRYETGTHGVPGNTNTYYGMDSVYTLTDNTLMQCLCPDNGQGIQTNWWKVTDLTQEQIKNLQQQGWIYIPNGAVWGLDEAPYLAKNENYVCRGGIGGSGGSQGGSSGSSNSGSSAGAASVAGSVGEVLGLASTGNSTTVLFYLVSGVTLLSLGFYLQTVHTRKTS